MTDVILMQKSVGFSVLLLCIKLVSFTVDSTVPEFLQSPTFFYFEFVMTVQCPEKKGSGKLETEVVLEIQKFNSESSKSKKDIFSLLY